MSENKGQSRESGSNSSDHVQEKLGSSVRKEPQRQNGPLACSTYFSFPLPAHILTPTKTGLILMSSNCVRVLSLPLSADSASLCSCFHSNGVMGDRENGAFLFPKQPCTKENTG